MKSGAPVRQATGGPGNAVSRTSLVKSVTASLQGISAVALKDYLPRDLFASSREVSNCSLNVSLLSGYLIEIQANVSLSCVYSFVNMIF